METLSRRKQLAWGLALGALFFLVYGPVNQYSAGLAPLPSLYLSWERDIPFLPWTVLPYMSLDLFFLLSFFQLRDRTELHRHALRLAVTILVSAALFLAFPMQFGFERPASDGLPGLLFSALALDLPFNQCPSLHVSLALVMWPVVRRMAGGLGRILLAGWFLLVMASTLFTYQHHLLDLFGGLILGLLVLQAIPLADAPPSPVGKRALALASRYAGGALVCLGSAIALGGWGLLLLHPFVSLSLVASAYLTGRADYLSKREGRHCAVVWLLFAPFLLGQRLTWHYYRGRVPAWSEVRPGLYAGRRLTGDETRALRALGVHQVIDLSPEIAESPGWKDADYHHRPWLDLVPPSATQRAEVEALIGQCLGKGPVYLHCNLGLGRSMRAALDRLEAEGASPDAARAALAGRRPLILPGDTHPSPIRSHREEPEHA